MGSPRVGSNPTGVVLLATINLLADKKKNNCGEGSGNQIANPLGARPTYSKPRFEMGRGQLWWEYYIRLGVVEGGAGP